MMPNFFSYVRAAKYKEKWNYIRYLLQNKNWLKSKETAKQHSENKKKVSSSSLARHKSIVQPHSLPWSAAEARLQNSSNTGIWKTLGDECITG